MMFGASGSSSGWFVANYFQDNFYKYLGYFLLRVGGPLVLYMRKTPARRSQCRAWDPAGIILILTTRAATYHTVTTYSTEYTGCDESS